MPIIPFTPDLIPQAARLLAERHRQDRARLPLLPAEFEDEAAAGKAITAVQHGKHSRGLAAVEGGRLQGYLIGSLDIDQLWGRSAWIRPAGLALAPGQPSGLIREMYAALAEEWVRWGVFFHFTVVPVSQPELIDAFFRLSFGIEQIYGLLDIPRTLEAAPAPPAGLSIRHATAADRPTLEAFSHFTWQYQTGSPTFGIHLPESEQSHAQQYAGLAEDPEAQTWLAFDEQGQALGFQVYFAGEGGDDNLLSTTAYSEMPAASTHPAARRRGVMRHMLHAALPEQLALGRTICQTDWRTTNLLSSRAWPALGFQEAHYRLVRRIDPRITWAR